MGTGFSYLSLSQAVTSQDIHNRYIDPVMVLYISNMKEINISITYLHHGQEKSIFW